MIDGQKKQGTKRRRRFVWLVALVAIAIIGWQLIEHYVIDIERYQPYFVAKITEKTGLPASIGSMDVALRPLPVVHAYDVRVGDENLEAAAENVILHLELEPLLRRLVHITDIELRGLTLHIPEDIPLAEKYIKTIREHARPSGKPYKWNRQIDRIWTEGAIIYLGDRKEPVAAANGEALHILEDEFPLVIEALLPVVGEDAQLAAELSVTRDREAVPQVDVTGAIRLAGIQTSNLIEHPRAPRAEIRLDADLVKGTSQEVVLAINGAFSPVAEEQEEWTMLKGPFSGMAYWQTGTLTINDIAVDASGLKLAGDLTRYPDGLIGVEIPEATATSNGLAFALATASTEKVLLSPGEKASLTINDLLVARDNGNGLRLVRGSAQFDGIDVAIKDRGTAFAGVNGEVQVDDGLFNIARLEGQDVAFTGKVTPDFEARTAAVTMTGSGKLSPARLHAFVDAKSVTGLEGAVQVDELSATFGRDEGIPADLSIQGAWTGGRLEIDSQGYDDTFEQISVTFTAHAETIATEARAVSKGLGPVHVKGDYAIAPRAWQGTVAVDLTQMALLEGRDDFVARVLPPLLASFGPSDLAVNAVFPQGDGEVFSADAARVGDRELAAAIVLAKNGAWRLETLAAHGIAPVESLAPVTPALLSAAGWADIEFTASRPEAAWHVALDLTQSTVRMGQYVKKGVGQPASILANGIVADPNWRADALTVRLLDEEATGLIDGEQLSFDPLSIDLASLAPLLPEGAAASGLIRGSIVNPPTQVHLKLDKVAFTLSPELSIDNVTGDVHNINDVWTFDHLAFHGANSNYVVNATYANAFWQGSLAGEQLDVNAAAELIRALRSYGKARSPEDAKTPPKTESGDTIKGSADVRLDTLLYRRGALSDLSANVNFDGHGILIENIHARPYSGSITGAVDIAYPTAGQPRRVSMDLTMNEINTRIIDELIFIEPREFSGTLNGVLRADYALIDGVEPMDTLNGTAAFNAVNGTFGKLGLTTKLLTLLRTTEVLQLKLPSIRDEGLAYDTAKGQMTAANGLMTLHEMEVRNPTMLLKGGGTMDFVQEATNIDVSVNLLGTVTGIMEIVGLDKIVKGVRNVSSVRIAVTGPPTDPNASIAGFGEVKTEAPPENGGNAPAPVDSLKDTVDAVGGLIENLLN